MYVAFANALNTFVQNTYNIVLGPALQIKNTYLPFLTKIFQYVLLLCNKHVSWDL